MRERNNRWRLLMEVERLMRGPLSAEYYTSLSWFREKLMGKMNG